MKDVEGLLDALGGPATVHKALRALGHEIGTQTVYVWKYRRSIPSKWLGELLRVAQAQGKKLDLGKYL